VCARACEGAFYLFPFALSQPPMITSWRTLLGKLGSINSALDSEMSVEGD
jgi:hypothetical protein